MTAAALVPYAGPEEHLHAQLQWLDLLLVGEVVRFRADHPEPPDRYRGLYISEADVDRRVTQALEDRGADAPATEGAQPTALPEMAAEYRRHVDERARVSISEGRPLPLDRIQAAFGLIDFDRAVLLLACAPDLDGRFETLFAYLQDDVTRRRPTIDLALRVLAPDVEPGWRLRERFSAMAPLSRYGLVRASDEQPFLARPLRAEDRVIDALLSIPGALDARLLPFTELADRGPPEPAGVSAELERELGRWLRLWSGRSAPFRPVAVFEGPAGSEFDAAVQWVAAGLHRPVLHVSVARLLGSHTAAGELEMLLARECLLHGALLQVSEVELLTSEHERAPGARAALTTLLRAVPVPAILCSNTGADVGSRVLPGLSVLPQRFPVPDYARRVALWRQALEMQGLAPAPVENVANKFQLTSGQIADAAAMVGHHCRQDGGREPTEADLQASARAHSHHGLVRLAHKLEPVHGWGDIVLPQPALIQLREIAAAVEHRHRVYLDWGFGERLSRGKGLNVMFSGVSGTGKTMAAEVLARELGLDLYAIDLATVVSKYIGETEKNLRRIFDEAQSSNAILFFDEADALFGKRSEVRDSHDRYANIEIAYLLQLMEQYEGIAILATNLSKNVDDAFARRMHHVVDFPFPTPALRREIWSRSFPCRTPVAGEVDFAFLAHRFELAGGGIVNAALGAAVLAAADGGMIGMRHVAVAVAREYRKVGRLPGPAEFEPYYAEVLRYLGSG